MIVIATALLYFGIVFALAFALGVARVLVVAPAIGPAAAVFLEVPIVLAASWLVARWLLRDRHFQFPQRLAVGGIAFALLMVSEALLAAAIFGQSLSQWIAAVLTPLGLVGLAGQLGFAVMPCLTPESIRPGQAR